MPIAIESAAFVSAVRPLLETNNFRGLLNTLRQRWDCSQICRLVANGDRDTRKVALLCLALVGERECIELVASELTDPDATINHMAEHAMWSIWFRCGSPAAIAELTRGAKAVADRRLDLAADHFNKAIEFDRNCAEGYNQRAIVRFLQDRFEDSISDCRKAIRLMPCHFGAWAGMGHCFVHLGQLDHALRAYQQAIANNPHLDGVHETIAEIQRRVARRS